MSNNLRFQISDCSQISDFRSQIALRSVAMIINRDRESRDTRFLSVIECAMTAQNFQGAIDWQRIDCVTAPGRRGGAKERVVDCFFGRLDHRKEQR